MADPQLLGDRILPERVRERRQSLRSRLDSIRDPIRQRREDLSPVNIVGMVESNVQDLRDRIVSRTDVLTRIRQRRQGGSGNSGAGSQNNTGNSGNANANTGSSTETNPSTPKPGRGRGDDVDQLM